MACVRAELRATADAQRVVVIQRAASEARKAAGGPDLGDECLPRRSELAKNRRSAGSGASTIANDIPLIDVSTLSSPHEAARRGVATRIGAACREVGFFAIEGHGVPAPLVAETFAASARFFALPIDAKHALAIGTLGGNRGYVGLGVEALDETTAADHKEALNLVWSDRRARPADIWPALPGFEDVVQRYFDAVLAVGRRLHAAFALDLGLDEAFFVDKLDRPLATLRLLRYPAHDPAAVRGQLGAGTHTDYGNVTLLATDGVAGLQVRRRDGRWIDAPATAGAFLCNIGDCLMRWTNDVYVSTPHRVVAPVAERYSIALFVDPNPDAMVSAIASCIGAGDAPRYPPIRAGDYLAQRFASTYGEGRREP